MLEVVSENSQSNLLFLRGSSYWAFKNSKNEDYTTSPGSLFHDPAVFSGKLFSLYLA